MTNKNKNNSLTFAFVLTTIIALSGWGTILFNWITSTPKIEGHVLGLITFEISSAQFTKPIPIISPYLYLVNKRKNPVHILDYELEFDLGDGYEKALRLYGTRKLPQPNFSHGELSFSIPNYQDKLIYSKNAPLDYGFPVHGFALFSTHRPYSEIKVKIKKIRVTCIDAFRSRHSFEYEVGQDTNIYLLQDITGMEVYEKSDQIDSK